MAETVITEVVVPVAKWTLTKLWQELGYMCCYKSNIGDLNKQIEQLRNKRNGVDKDVNCASDALKTIDDEVDHWLRDVENIIKEKETTFSEETVAAKATCYNGWLPNLKGRFSLGRKAKKMTLEVDQLRAKDFRTIAHSPSHPEVKFRPTEDSTQLGTNFHDGASSSGTSTHEQRPASEGKNIDFKSRRSTVEAVMKALEENQTNPIIICGLGGIGKTTLMGQVHDRAKKEGLFDEYTMATFKESLDVIQIQDELAEYLGKELLKELKEIGPRASKLRERLSQGSKKILVMLDNVWTTTPDFLWEIGIPHSCKLLVTSRQKELFKNMDTRKNFVVDGLPDTDAWSLFKRTAGSCIESDLELHVVAKKVLKECGGLPIAISTVGMALKGEGIGTWKDALVQLENACPENIDGVIKDVYGPIKFSYESLANQSLPGEEAKSEAKSCFLLCCIFGGSADIQIEDLVRYGLGLGLFKGTDSMVIGRNRVNSLVQKLKSRFLLLDTDDPELVRMHDVVRDVAVYIASEEFANRIVVRDTTATVKLMDWPKDSDSEEILDCSSLDVSGHCQLLRMRIRESLSLWNAESPPPTILNRMEDLKVLAMYASEIWIRLSLESLVPSLADLRNLQTLRLEYCHFDDCDISVIGKLRKLMILSLRGSDIKQLPETFKDLSDLRVLDLTDCRYLREIAPGVISSLYQLEELYMRNSFQDWVVEKLASTETTNWISQLENDSEVERWKRLNRSPVEQPARARNPFLPTTPSEWSTTPSEWSPWQERWAPHGCIWWHGDHPEGVGSKFPVAREGPTFVGDVKETLYRLKNDEKYTNWANSMDWETGLLGELLCLSRLTTLQVSLQPVHILLTTALFSKLERFWISIGWESPPFFISEKLSDNYLRVSDLDGSVAMGSCITKLLEKASHVELKLTQLPQLVNVLDRVCFAKTKRLKFQECNDVKHLFNTTTNPHSSSAIFPVLHTLEISSAERLKEIFHCELPTGSLQQLRELKLYKLPECTYIWKRTNSRSEWGVWRDMIGHVQVLEVICCSSLKGIIVKDRDVYYDDEEVINFQCLTELTLYDLKSFTGIISKRPEILPEDISPEQSDVPMQPLFDAKVHFPVLTKLDVSGIVGKEIRYSGINCKEIWNNQLSKDSFCELKSLLVCGFDNLLHLVPTHMQNRLQKLESIKAGFCPLLEEIFESRRLTVSDEGDATALTISESGDQGTQMKKMVSFKQSRQAFQNLREMRIWNCDSLRTLLSPSVARGLVKLQKLRVTYCEKIEEIVAAAAEGEETEDANLFPQLHSLELRNLPNLGSFSQGKYNLKWPVANCIIIDSCGKMKKFCSGSLITSKELKIIDIEFSGESLSQELKDSRQEIDIDDSGESLLQAT